MGASSVIYCRGWSAWAPGLPSVDAWYKWLTSKSPYPHAEQTTPSCKKVPPMMRRRCTPLTRMVLEACYELAETHDVELGSMDMVFASRFGEISILEQLLGTMAENEALSPIDFCNSVHHTPTGYLSMASKNRGISRTVCAAGSTFCAGLLEVASLLYSSKQKDVLLLVGDEVIPSVFNDGQVISSFSFGAAMVFSNSEPPDQTDAGFAVNVFELANMVGSYKGGMAQFLKEKIQ